MNFLQNLVPVDWLVTAIGWRLASNRLKPVVREYTGLLLAVPGTALGNGEYRGLVAVTLVAFVLWRKLRLEERWLSETFGERYGQYKRRGNRCLAECRRLLQLRGKPRQV